MHEAIQSYIDLVKSRKVPVCAEQIQLVEVVEKAFSTENIWLDEEQLGRYLNFQKYFPYKLLPWEQFCFALHNCVYKADGGLRWPVMLIYVGRGAGKNGYLAFEDFCLLTPVNGVKNYDIDIFAMSEDQAKATFDDVYEILNGNEAYFKKSFRWTKEVIENLKTGSKLRFRTSAPKTKDGGRPGKVDFDEVHAYENYKLIDVATTGLGKKKYPRRTYATTDGDIRDGPLDDVLKRARKVLGGEIQDNGWLYFICRLDGDEEIHRPEAWAKANPSLYDPSRPELLDEIKLEYAEFLEDPSAHAAFATKRMNRPRGDKETEVTAWENILAASREFDREIICGKSAVFGVDYASTQDFVAALILIVVDGVYYCLTHSWVCGQSSGLPRIHFPIHQSEDRGELTIIDAPEISPETPVEWVKRTAKEYKLNILMGGIDHFRYTLLSKAFMEAGYNADRKKGNLKLTYTPEQSMVAPIISSAFLNHKIVWGDNMLMRWYTNNATRIIDKRGNISYGKIEPKTRKTDGFMALVAAFIVAQIKIDEMTYYDLGDGLPDVYTY